mmetsp:Transcript_12870/g.37363  ORF Transcript_12870/g.37363 Transcript_12870/m.37363 type:complete len:231 (+) Transcript_12870:78-770(+)
MLQLLDLPIQLVNDHGDEREQRQDQESEPRIVLLVELSASDSGKRLRVFGDGDQSHDEAHGQRDGSESDGALPLIPAQRRGLCEVASEFDDAPLRDHGERDDHEEHGGSVQGSHRIEAVANLAGVELVEDLAEHEGVEEDREVVRRTVLAIVHDGALVEEEDQQPQLVRGLDEDVSPHRATDQAGIALVRSAVQQLQSRRFRSQCEGTHGVHDQVHPKHHDCIQRRLVTG